MPILYSEADSFLEGDSAIDKNSWQSKNETEDEMLKMIDLRRARPFYCPVSLKRKAGGKHKEAFFIECDLGVIF